MLKLRSDLEQADKTSLQSFDFDIRSLDWKLFLENYLLGIRHFLLKNKPETLESSRKRLKLMKFLHYFVQFFFGFIFFYVLSRQLLTPVWCWYSLYSNVYLCIKRFRWFFLLLKINPLKLSEYNWLLLFFCYIWYIRNILLH